MSRRIVLGTRGSALALAQCALVERALRAANPHLPIETRTIVTSGDRGIDVPQRGAGKGLFTKEIEEALLREEIDVAIHSAKDLPGDTTPELEIAAVLERGPAADVLISKKADKLAKLPENSVVGTNSVRRERQLLLRRPDLRVERIRGNVPTRLNRLSELRELDALVLAQAGLQRLGHDVASGRIGDFFAQILDLMPAAGQGIIALQTRRSDRATHELLAPINHDATFRVLTAERELLRLLQGDCQLPLGVQTRVQDKLLSMRATVFDDNPRSGEATGAADEPNRIAADIFNQLYGR